MLGRGIGISDEKLQHLGDDPLPDGVYSGAEAAIVRYAQRSTKTARPDCRRSSTAHHSSRLPVTLALIALVLAELTSMQASRRLLVTRSQQIAASDPALVALQRREETCEAALEATTACPMSESPGIRARSRSTPSSDRRPPR